MIELGMVRRMATRGLFVSPLVVLVLALVGASVADDPVLWGISAAAGMGLSVANLYLAGRIIGGIAESNPQLLLVGALSAMFLGLGVLTGVALVLRALDIVYFPVTGLVLLGTHLALVLWEAAGPRDRLDGTPLRRHAANVRS